MPDPRRTGPARSAQGLTDGDKEARIEELLLSGLDAYFGGRYDEAINIWTRVVFLERGNSRARAYIERARGALAERHRESEELLHRGIAAFNSGQNDVARDLIARALQQGGPQDVALALMERLNRLSTPAGLGEPPACSEAERREAAAQLATSGPIPGRSFPARAALTGALIVAAIVVAIVVGVPLPGWLADPTVLPQEQVTAIPPDPLPVARTVDRLIDRARALQSNGRWLDAIRTLEGIDLADPARGEADRLRGELQRQLLEARETEASR